MKQSQQQFKVQVVYTIPSMDELRRRFPAGIDSDYEGISFKPIEACENVSREAREVAFELVHLGYDTFKNTILAELDKRGLRPALLEELLAFDAMYPGEVAKFMIVALGSEKGVIGRRRVASVRGDGDGRRFYLDWSENIWYGFYRFLAVRK